MPRGWVEPRAFPKHTYLPTHSTNFPVMESLRALLLPFQLSFSPERKRSEVIYATNAKKL